MNIAVAVVVVGQLGAQAAAAANLCIELCPVMFASTDLGCYGFGLSVCPSVCSLCYVNELLSCAQSGLAAFIMSRARVQLSPTTNLFVW